MSENGAQREGDDQEHDEEIRRQSPNSATEGGGEEERHNGRQNPTSAIERGAQEARRTRLQNHYGSGQTWHLRWPPHPVWQSNQ